MPAANRKGPSGSPCWTPLVDQITSRPTSSRPCDRVERIIQVHLQEEPPRAPVQGVNLGLHSHGHDLAGTPFGEGRLERGKGSGGIPSLGARQQPLRQ